jgi:acyl dehydratase
MSRDGLHFEDFFVGHVVEAAGPTVTKEEIVTFASQFDPQPFHLDEQQAAASPFRGLVASGWHTAAMCMRMMVDAYLRTSSSRGSPGVDELRWVKPVRPGDTLRLKATVLEVKPSTSKPEMGSVKSLWEVYNQHDECVMRMTGWGMFSRRSP